MVKKSSFLEKLKSRLRHTDLQVETPARGTVARDPVEARGTARPAEARGTARAAVPERAVTPERARVEAVPAVRQPELVSGRKMSQREEATVAVQDGFKELTSLLRGMQTRVEDQGERFAQAADGISRLPALQEAQLDAMRQLAERLEQQNRTNEVVVHTLGDLPALMGHVREALDRASATDERTASTLDDFRANMDRIQGSMDQMVDHSRQHADSSRLHAESSRRQAESSLQQAESAMALAQGREQDVRGLAEDLSTRQQEVTRDAVGRLEATQRDGVRSLRDAQADHATRLGKMMEEGTKTNRAVLVMLGLVFASLVTIAILLATN